MIHILHEGLPICGFTTALPRDWPDGHRWTRLDDQANATCPDCLRRTTPTLVEKLRAIAARITITRNAIIGPTGYLDEPLRPPEARMTKGVDASGRTFITLCVHILGHDDRQAFTSRGVVTVFQRYSNDEHLVTQASNSPRAPHLISGGSATKADLERLAHFVEWGEASCIVEDVAGGTLHEIWKLVSPESAIIDWK